MKTDSKRLASMALFQYFKKCAALRAGFPVADGHIGAVVGLWPDGMSRWRHGTRIVLDACVLRTLIRHTRADQSVVDAILDGVPWKDEGTEGPIPSPTRDP
jgi:hypothetical protein